MIDSKTGQTLTGWARMAARWQDVLTTPVGSRQRRRSYGSKLPQLQGQPLSDANKARGSVWVMESFYNSINSLGNSQLHQVAVTTGETGFIYTLTVGYQGEIKELIL